MARPGLGILDDTGLRRAKDRSEVDHVPHTPPGDKRRDAEGPGHPVLLVQDPRVRHLEVSEAIVANSGGYPMAVLGRDIDSDENGR